MSRTSTTKSQPVFPRHVEPLCPASERAALAMKAIREARWSDAEKHIAAVPESPLSDYAWRMYLSGWLDAERDEFPPAQDNLLRAVSAALVIGLSGEKENAESVMRLAAAAMEKLGDVYRRQECLEDAYRAHRAAYRLCEEHGSIDDQWQSLMSLAVDCTVARRDDEAPRWCRAAVELSAKTTERPLEKHAQAWGRLARAWIVLGRSEEAVAAARSARDFWRRHDGAARTAPRADLDLAFALMKSAEALYATDAAQARTLLEEALSFLGTAAEELPPFGPEAVDDVRRCAEQTDFSRRLLYSL